MLKPMLIGAAALSTLTAAPALADWDDDDDDYRRGGYGYEYDRDYRAEQRAEEAYHRGLTDGRRGYRNDKHQYRSKYVRKAYQDGFKDGRRQSARYRDRGHDDYGYYRRASADNWYDRDGRRYDSYERCRREGKVNAGTVLGGIAGGVLGNEVAGRGDKTVGTIIGAAAGAVLGHEVGKPDERRRCY